jgi:hypothetical protein
MAGSQPRQDRENGNLAIPWRVERKVAHEEADAYVFQTDMVVLQPAKDAHS